VKPEEGIVRTLSEFLERHLEAPQVLELDGDTLRWVPDTEAIPALRAKLSR
jgi:hypothetical protein